MRKLLAAAALLVSTSAFAAIPASQRDALVSLYNATGGPTTWTNREGWLGAPGTECDWYGLECDNDRTTVVEISLEINGLTGQLPASIGNFPDLRLLFLFDNPMSGPIPSAIGQLTKLESLILDRSGFTGPIPSSIGNLVNMTFFNADGNQLTGPLPRELGNLRSLEEIDLSFNNIDGVLPFELGQLSNLRALDINSTRLSGPIPAALGNLSKLEQLTLIENDLIGQIPPSLGNLASLHTLRLSNNELTGPIPALLGSMPSLVTLDLGNNHLSGTIPRDLGNLPQLKNLYLHVNELEGTIPLELFRISTFEELFLNNNRLTGPLPREIGQLRSLRKLNVSSNPLTGTIPSEIGLLTELIELELLNNRFTGSIPTEITRLTKLGYLELAGNQLTGPIPAGIGALKNLFYFSVYENQLSGAIPSELGELTELQTLYLTSNQFTGPIPDSLRNLKKLILFYLAGNQLTGPVPEWIGELTELIVIFFPGNQLTGEIPRSIGNLTNLTNLYLDYNQMSGSIPREIGNLRNLEYFSLEVNDFSGPLPIEMGQLTNLIEFRAVGNHFSGPLPRDFGKLAKLQTLLLDGSDLEGPLPAEIGNLSELLYLDLGSNRFSGPIPPELGKLTKLLNIDLSANAFRGEIPAALTGMTSLEPFNSDFAYNALFTNNAAVRAFINSKQFDGDFERTQNLPPTNVRVTAVTDRSATVEWDLVRFTEGRGGYQVVASTSPGGPPVVIATTSSKEIGSIIVRGLDAQTTYFFTVATVSHPDELQKNLLVSDPTAPVSATTTARVFAPADVAVTSFPAGLVQINGVGVNEDSFTLTNFGDQSTDITFFIEGDFYTITPDRFTLGPGASQTVRILSVPKPPGTYYGYLKPEGNGSGEDVYVTPTLLSVVRPTGTVIAEPVSTRIDVAGAPGSDSIGQARFRNRGTASLTGLLISDQPWIVPNTDTIRIDPGQESAVNFRVIRSRRPPEAEGNALTGNLMLVYIDGSIPLQMLRTLAREVQQAPGPPSGINVSLVSVVDQPRPPVAPSQVPQFGSGEVALFASGVVSNLRETGRFVSDVSLLNLGSARPINDLRVFFTPVGAAPSSVATIGSIDVTKAVTLANVVTNVYGSESGTGTLQFRSASAQSLSALAKLVSISGNGTMTGDIPLFRSDRSIAPGQQLLLPGVRKSATLRTDLYVQETIGAAARARVEFLDASGASAAASREVELGPFMLAELPDAVPASAATVVITNIDGSSGRVAAYGRIIDGASGDSWSIVDWSRLNRFRTTEPMRVPFADASTGETPQQPPGRRRRVVGRDAIDGDARTELTLFNPTTEESVVTVEMLDRSGRSSPRELRIAPRQTVVTTIDAPAVQALVNPSRGSVAVTARTYRSGNGTFGTNVPILDARAGLRLGQLQRFANLDDSTAATVAAGKPGTYRTAFGFVETSGSPVTVRARMTLNEGRSLVSAVIAREFTIGANQQVLFENLVRAIVGDQRETRLGELHNLQLTLDVTSGQGSVVPFVVVTDNGTGDSLLRIE